MMFNKLKLKLTLANLLVVVLIFAIVFSGVYVMMYDSITDQSEQIMKTLFYRIMSGGNILDDNFLELLGSHSFIVVELSSEGKIVDFMSYPIGTRLPEGIDIPGTGWPGLNKTSLPQPAPGTPPIGKTSSLLSAPGTPDTIKSSNGGTYRRMMYRRPDNGMALIFVNVDYEISLLKSLRYTLLVEALVGLVLVFLGSLFMAGRAVKPVKAAWEKQRDFVADASHELRTPLSVIQTNLELVMDNKEETVESQVKWLENIYFENRHMTKLVSDLLLLARTDSGQTLLEKKEFSLSAAVEAAVVPFAPVAEEKKLILEYKIATFVNFFGDESRLKQLVLILLDNAMKFTPSDGRVSLELIEEKDQINIKVSDTGIGIAKEDIGKIFERFYRADKARNSENGGTGLGLSIANWIVKEHNGTISVESLLGKGTTFNVTLPKQKR